MQWWKKDPILYKKFKEELQDFPSLKFRHQNNDIIIEGQWFVYGAEYLIEKYDITIIIPENYPNDVPSVFETGNKIIRNADHHINNDGSACLFVPPQRWEHWPINSNIKDFLEKPVKQYFFSQAYFSRTGQWPFGEWAHFEDGIIQFYFERLNISSLSQLLEFQKLAIYHTPARQWKCPCGKGRYVKCHWEKMKRLIEILPISEWELLKIAIREKSLSL